MPEECNWVITRLDVVDTHNLNICIVPSKQWLALKGYCKNTNIKKCEFGPFKSMESLLDFAQEKELRLYD